MRNVAVRRIKKHRTYTYNEAANALGIHVRTVQTWVKQKGLIAYQAQRPHLIRGVDLSKFLASEKETRKAPTTLSQLYCLRCRAPRRPAADMIDFQLPSSGAAQLTALCSVCEGTMHKRVSRGALDAFREIFDVTVTQAERTLKRRGLALPKHSLSERGNDGEKTMRI